MPTPGQGRFSKNQVLSKLNSILQVALMQYMNEGMPRVSYTKAIDVWMSVCLFFIFLSMCEYAVAHVFLQYEEAEAEKAANMQRFSDMSLGTTQGKQNKNMLNFNHHTPDWFTPSHARCAENCGSALSHC